MKYAAIGVCLALLSRSAFAQTPDVLHTIDARYKACLTKANGVTTFLNNCSFDAKSAADKVLNRAYDSWVDQLKHPAKNDAHDDAEILKRLIVAERAWINYRDTACNLESTSMLGGTGETTVYGDCLYRLTKQRVLDLKTVQGSR